MAGIMTACQPFLVHSKNNPREPRNFVATAQCYGGTFQQFQVRLMQERDIECRWVEDATGGMSSPEAAAWTGQKQHGQAVACPWRPKTRASRNTKQAPADSSRQSENPHSVPTGSTVQVAAVGAAPLPCPPGPRHGLALPAPCRYAQPRSRACGPPEAARPAMPS